MFSPLFFNLYRQIRSSRELFHPICYLGSTPAINDHTNRNTHRGTQFEDRFVVLLPRNEYAGKLYHPLALDTVSIQCMMKSRSVGYFKKRNDSG